MQIETRNLAELRGQHDKQATHNARVQEHYDRLASERALWISRNSYFYKRDLKNLTQVIPEGARVLEIGCGNGDMLARLKPSYGVGVDLSPRMVEEAQKRHPDLDFRVANIEEDGWHEGLEGPFDVVLLSDVVGHLFDVQRAMERLHGVMSRETKLITTFVNRWWEPLAHLYIRLGLGMPRPPQNWLSRDDFHNLLLLTDFDLVSFRRRELSPRRMLGIGSILNRVIAPLPGFNYLSWRYYVVARSRRQAGPEEKTVTALVPCRNEKGNIEACVLRLPEMGLSKTEILFVEGNSSDGTYEECLRVRDAYPERNIRVLKQTGKGKGDAVRLGFSEAKGDVVMIVDSDLAVPPEYMLRVYRALADGTAEFVNCTRLVYPMEAEAMRPLNYVANRLFAVIFSYLLEQRLTDTLCGTKALYREDYLRIEEERQRLGSLDPFGDFDLIFGAARRNLRMVEIPVRYDARTYGETQISRFRDGVRLFRMVWQAFRRLKTR